jgi:hypothetical protein
VRPDMGLPERLIWATRGRSWGFLFLLTGGLADPLPEYDRVFAELGHEPAAWRRAAGKGALRFPDPLGRKDAAGRVIPHEFVVSGDLADRIESVDGGRQLVWPRIEAAYARVWDAERPPSAADLGLPDRDAPSPSGEDWRAPGNSGSGLT